MNKFIDTADVYSGGRCEEMLGQFIAETMSQVIRAGKVRY